MGGSVPNLQELGIHKAQGEMLDWFRQEVRHLLECDGFPGAQPVSFNRAHIDELKQRDYYVCEKSDGIRALLYFTRQQRNGEESEMHFLIDRKNDFYVVDGLHFPRAPDDGNADIDFASWHCDTMLDGELLWDQYPNGRRELKYLVFDTLCVDGKLLTNRPLHKRLAYFIEKIYKPYEELLHRFPDDCSSFRFRVEQKSFQLAYGTELMFREVLPQLPHGNDGLIFTCTETPYKFKTDEHILKWKPAEENTVDFRMGLRFPPAPADDEWEFDYNAVPEISLFVLQRDREDQYFENLYVLPEEWEEMKRYATTRNDGLDGQVVECHLDDQRRWRFFRFRDDKKEANHVSVVHKVLASIEDGVTKEELVQAAGGIRAAWKAPDREQRRRQLQSAPALPPTRK